MNIRNKQIAVFFALVLCQTAMGSGGEAAAGAEGGINIFAGGWGTAFWSLLLFVILLVVLRKWAWGPILTGLQKREEHIRVSIEDAEKAKRQAEDSLKQYQEQLARAQSEAEAILAQGRQAAESLSQQMKDAAQREARGLREQAARDIEAARDQALRSLQQQTVSLAEEMAGRILERNLTAEDHQKLLQDSLARLGQKRMKS